MSWMLVVILIFTATGFLVFSLTEYYILRSFENSRDDRINIEVFRPQYWKT